MCYSNPVIKLARHNIICTCSVNVRCSDTAELSTGLRLSEWPQAIRQSLFLSPAKQKTVQMKWLSNWTHTHTHLHSPFRQVIRTKAWYAALKGHFTVLHIHSFLSLLLFMSSFSHLHYNPPWFSPVYVCAYSTCVKAEAERYKRLLTMFIW